MPEMGTLEERTALLEVQAQVRVPMVVVAERYALLTVPWPLSIHTQVPFLVVVLPPSPHSSSDPGTDFVEPSSRQSTQSILEQ